MLTSSDAAAWTAALLFPLTALAGWSLRRFVRGPFIPRMRPHFVVGYAVVGLALVHTALSLQSVSSMSRPDVWSAFLAIGGLGLETFAGLSLQAPGTYRTPLRRWHNAIFWSVGVLIVAHVVFTGL